MALFFATAFLDFIFLILLLFGLLYYAYKRRYSFWKNKGVFYLEPSIPFGNIMNTVLTRKQIGMDFYDIYNKSKNQPYLGIYMMHTPTLVINDVDLIKTILTTDFIHFTDHGLTFNEEVEPLTGHLFNIRGEKWKKLRGKLSPTFTSSKMKNMFDVVAACAIEMGEYLDENIDASKNIEDVKEIMAKYTTDVIASCAFGVESQCFKNPDSKFRKMGRRIFEPGTLESILQLLDFFIPNSITKFKVAVLGTELQDFFYGLVEDTVNYREKNGIVRNDFMQLLIELKNKGSVADDETTEVVHDDGTRLTMMQLAAQAFIFFIGGFETSSSTSSFALYELAMNPDVQQTLAEEIDDVVAKYGGKLKYEALSEMPYMTKVIEETLRKYPSLPIIFRICTKDYIIPGTNIKIEKETPVMIPIYAIHWDPRYYPKPEKFDPSRFDAENKASRHNFSYLPFGEGPRICIGSRFGMMQTKLGLAMLLSKYTVSVCDKTQIPLEFNKKSFVLASDEGLYLKLTKRN